MSKTVSMPKKSSAQKEVVQSIKLFPYLNKLFLSINKIQELIDLLEKRIQFAKEELPHLISDKEINECEILIMETEMKISKHYRVKEERKAHFEQYQKSTAELLPEVNENFAALRKEAILKSKEKDNPKAELLKKELAEETCKSHEFNRNYDLKFRHYLELKRILTEEPAAETEKDA